MKKSTESSKYLGVLINPDLKWNDHFKYVTDKMRKSKGALYRGKKALNSKSLQLLYNALIESHFTYANEIWFHTLNKKQKQEMQSIQNGSLRIAAKVTTKTHSNPINKKLEIIKLDDRNNLITIKLLLHLYRKDLPYYPKRILSLFQFKNTRTRSGVTLNTMSKRGKFLSQVLKVFNTYSDFILNDDLTIDTIIEHIKQSVLSQYSIECTQQNCFVCQMSR